MQPVTSFQASLLWTEHHLVLWQLGPQLKVVKYAQLALIPTPKWQLRTPKHWNILSLVCVLSLVSSQLACEEDPVRMETSDPQLLESPLLKIVQWQISNNLEFLSWCGKILTVLYQIILPFYCQGRNCLI